MVESVKRALAGISVLELGSGIAMAYCGRLLADAGAGVRRCISSTEQCADAGSDIFDAYLAAGKSVVEHPQSTAELKALCERTDIVLIGEDTGSVLKELSPRRAVVELSWFGKTGPYKDWKGTDLIVQALTAMPHLAGRVEGPPLYAGDRHSLMVAGVSAYIAALTGILSGEEGHHFELSVFEANLVLSEMDIHFVERDGVPLERHGLNRFSPNGPVGIYKCKEGWVGITCTTPDQWRSLCIALGMEKEGRDPTLLTREMRFARLDEVEQAMTVALSTRSSADWAAILRKYRVPGVVVPDASGILAHPIFEARCSLASFNHAGKVYRAPRAPFGLTITPTAKDLDAAEQLRPSTTAPGTSCESASRLPLSGFRVVDFTMGWAGPLASRLLADMGATVIKIEAGRYPDWWRGVNWTPEFIASKLYENAKGFCALNRGKRGVSIDLTHPKGRELALSLVAKADGVIDNQAAGVMSKLGLGYDALSGAKPNVVVTSMSAFGTGNAWSDTRAYGSTLEQGSGLPSFMGSRLDPPTMAHLAYGDPVGGLFGCAAFLTALVHQRATGEGQYVNVSMVEAMLQFATPALLSYQSNPRRGLRIGNRHQRMCPHGIYRCAEPDSWLAIAVTDDIAFAKLAIVLGKPGWVSDGSFTSIENRKVREEEIDNAISAWARAQSPGEAASRLQEVGVAAAPVLHTEEIIQNEHLVAENFFIDLERKISGPQRQAGIAIKLNDSRLGSRQPAPLMGQHSWQVLHEQLSLTKEEFSHLVRDGIVSFEPTSLRSGVIEVQKA